MNTSISHYLIVTLSYLGFTLSDGALRMLVLFYFFKLGFSPLTLALLFLLYEFAGVVANLGGGWLTTRFGIRIMLLVGLSLQIIGLIFLSLLDPSFDYILSIIWVLAAQGISGLAKDFTKTASKSAIKSMEVDGRQGLFYWVSWFTGSKNAMKGIGFFLGGILLTKFGFQNSLWVMAGSLGLVLLLVSFLLPKNLGTSRPSGRIKELFSKSPEVNKIALARIFLFGGRDIWFVVAIPIFLYTNGWDFWEVGGFLAGWTVFYGLVQAIAPNIIYVTNNGKKTVSSTSILVWSISLALVSLFLLGIMSAKTDLLLLLSGLILFGFVFAINSSLHSFLIVAYAGSKKAAEDIGFYYAANAAGRLFGTFLSGLLFQLGGVLACLAGTTLFLIATSFVVWRLPELKT
jgi:MFS family permease